MEQRETSGLTTRLIVEYVRQHTGDSGVGRLLELAGDDRPLSVLENPRVWSSYAQRSALFAAAAVVTGDTEVARRIGASVLHSHGSALLRSVLVPFRSPSGVLKALPMVHAKLDTAGESRLLEVRQDYAMLSFRILEPYLPTGHDCLYIEGLLGQLPALFGMRTTFVSQPVCQLHGAPACVIEAKWRTRARRRGRRGEVLEQADFARIQLDELETTLAELIRTTDTDELLGQLTHRAGSAVAAQRLLLAVRMCDEEPLRVHAEGIDLEEAERVAPLLVLGQDLSVAGAGQYSLRSEVCSSQRRYGTVAAFSTGPFGGNEQSLLDAYARLAATALDTRLAIEVANERRHVAEVLNAFARQLIAVESVVQLSLATVEAASRVTAVDNAILLEHDEETGTLVTLAHRGYPDAAGPILDKLVVRPEDTPWLTRFLRAPAPRVYDGSCEDHYMRSMMAFFGLQAVALVPVKSNRRVFGLLIAGWAEGKRAPGVSDELIARFAGVADQAAGAWSKALLLEQVHMQATTDPLTGLANRRAFTEMLAERLGRLDGPRMAVLFCDLDRFKGVNDVFGHAAGDDLLQMVGHRLQECVRSDDLVARLGGDEFTVLLTDIDGGWSPGAFTDKVRSAMAEPLEIEGAQVVVRLSIGAVIAVPGESTVRDVLRKADAAMYCAKSNGGDRLLMFEDAMLFERSERVDLEAALSQAVAEPDQFQVLYQPQVSLDTRRVVAAEALVRWHHPTKGLLTPDRFLPVAEETGLIVAIDLHVLRTACSQAVFWRSIGLELKVAVNFSPSTLTSPDVVAAVRAALVESGLPGSLLELEITESSAASDMESLSGTLLALSDLGISVAIDDVGTRFSSLALLYRLPAQRIKIDRSFVNQVPEDGASRSVVEAVMLLATRLGQGVVAEGIETMEQARELQALGCGLGQGYLFSRPVAPEQIVTFARRVQAGTGSAGNGAGPGGAGPAGAGPGGAGLNGAVANGAEPDGARPGVAGTGAGAANGAAPALRHPRG